MEFVFIKYKYVLDTFRFSYFLPNKFNMTFFDWFKFFLFLVTKSPVLYTFVPKDTNVQCCALLCPFITYFQWYARFNQFSECDLAQIDASPLLVLFICAFSLLFVYSLFWLFWSSFCLTFVLFWEFLMAFNIFFMHKQRFVHKF